MQMRMEVAIRSGNGGNGVQTADSMPVRKNAAYDVIPLLIPPENFPKNSKFGVYLQV